MPVTRNPIVLRTVLAAILSALISSAAIAEPATVVPLAPPPTRDMIAAVFAETLRQTIGAPAKVVLGDQATIRLSNSLMFVPPLPAIKLLLVTRRPAPASDPGSPDIMGLLLGYGGLDISGLIRFAHGGFTDADSFLAWTPDDVLASLRDTVEQANPERIRQHQQELEARAWVQPPHYDAQTHQLAWAALIVPKSAPRGAEGEIVYHAVGFGRDGSIELSIASSVEKAEQVERMTTDFLDGLKFLPGKGYTDAGPRDHRAENGLAAAMGLDRLHRAPAANRFWSSEMVIPAAGGLVAVVGGVSLVLYFMRHTRREARRG
jgi:uncharacterized membrane-anchored protein